MSSFPLTNSIIFQDCYCTTNQYLYPSNIPLSPVVRWYTTNFRRRNVNFSGPEGATPLGNGALAAEPGLAEASRRVLAGFAQAVDYINCMSLSEYVYIYIIIITITITITPSPSPSSSSSSSPSPHCEVTGIYQTYYT